MRGSLRERAQPNVVVVDTLRRLLVKGVSRNRAVLIRVAQRMPRDLAAARAAFVRSAIAFRFRLGHRRKDVHNQLVRLREEVRGLSTWTVSVRMRDLASCSDGGQGWN